MVNRNLQDMSRISHTTRRQTTVISLLAVFAFALCCAGCEKIRRESPETVALTLRIGMPSASLALSKADGTASADPYEGIRTLRVLVISEAADPSQRQILYNGKHTVDGSSTPAEAVTSHSLTIPDIPSGPAGIYIIANEESIGIEYTDHVLTSPEYLHDSKLLLLDEGWQHFPRTYEDIREHGLPMSGRAEGVEIGPDMRDVSINLYRAVVKLHLTVKNETEGELSLQWVKFGEFISDRVYMFRQTQLDIPDDTDYKSLRYPENESETFQGVTLAAGGATQWNSVYIYPNYAYRDPTGSNPYTLSIGTDRKDYPPSLLSDNMNSMVRNSQYNITARITASATVVIDYEKVGWELSDVDVPSFD